MRSSKNFSVLISIYKNEKVEYFNEAILSVMNQTIIPNEIVIVKDGPLYKELDEEIDKWKNRYNRIFKIISLKKNVGLGEALRIGMEHCSFNIIARMDSDDISEKCRFEKQLYILDKYNFDLVGSYIDEFKSDINEEKLIKYVPKSNEEIYEYAKKRCPLNHPTVMFKKEAINDVGGYKSWHFNEDYYLWIRMIVNGKRMCNIPEVLVHMRVSDSTYERRGGIKYFKSEVRLQKKLKELGYINSFQMLRNIIIRMIVQILIPNKLRKFIYKKIFRNNH